MTFDEWLETNKPLQDVPKKALAFAAWHDATRLEREACANIAMDVPLKIDGMFSDDCKATAWSCAAAIRNRK